MFTQNFRRQYREAWNRLFDIVRLRNLLQQQQLNSLVAFALSVTPARNVIYAFDTDLARELLAEIDKLTPRIDAGMKEVNGYAELTGSPTVRWQSMRTGWSV